MQGLVGIGKAGIVMASERWEGTTQLRGDELRHCAAGVPGRAKQMGEE